MKALRGLYAVTPELPRPGLSLPRQVELAIAGGAAIIRTHNVVAGLQTARVADAIVGAVPASEG